MKLLKCKLCRGEMEVIGNEHAISKKVKCLKCGYANFQEAKVPEVIIIKRKLNENH